MGYKMAKKSRLEIRLEKYTEPKGFFRNTTGSLKIGEIELFNSTNEGWFEDFLTEEDGTYYMELGSVNGFGLIYRGKAPQISIGDKKNNIPIEDRIKFLYEALSSNYNYNCLGIIYKDTKFGGYKKSLFEIDLNGDDDDATFNINDL